MLKLPPIYKEHGKTYQADSCHALVRGVEGGAVRLEALVRGQYPGRRLVRGALPGVCTVGFWDAEHDQDWGLTWHRNEGLELTLLESGRLAFAVDDDRHRLEPGDLTVTRPWQPHRVGDPHVTAGRLHWLILDVGVRRPHQAWRWPPWLVLTEADRRELARMFRQNEQGVWHATADIRRCFRRIARSVEADRSGSHVSRLAVCLNDLFVLVLDMFRQQGIPLDESLSSTRRTVELFLADVSRSLDHLALPWTVRSMARQCGLGVTQFVHHAKQVTNLTPAQFLAHCRLEAACKLLTERPQMSVTEVAMACGFSSSQYFATAFRRRFGCSPRAVRAAPDAPPGRRTV